MKESLLKLPNSLRDELVFEFSLFTFTPGWSLKRLHSKHSLASLSNSILKQIDQITLLFIFSRFPCCISFIFVTLIFVMKYGQIQIQNQENNSQLSRAINYLLHIVLISKTHIYGSWIMLDHEDYPAL